ALRPSVTCRRGGITIVQKIHIVADEHFVFNRHAFTNEGVTLNLAARADLHALLDFHERADRRFVADFASVRVDGPGAPQVASQPHTGGDTYEPTAGLRPPGHASRAGTR